MDGISERDAVPPAWQRIAWALTWIGFGASTVLLSGSVWIFPAYAAVMTSFVLLARRTRHHGYAVRQGWGSVTRRDAGLIALAVVASVVAGVVWARYDQPWLMLVLMVVTPLVALVDMLRDDRRRTAEAAGVSRPA